MLVPTAILMHGGLANTRKLQSADAGSMKGVQVA